ncbi:polyamine ABC transporter ATP-binding protein [Chimaeribacter californicus]|uniref:Polyamine ABC transporter ATP-binding protein n=1 Tax=Chimaeribacter californicus TaxID=2060067 RepID=A0A2N5E281_9GAMM|nr:ABC transporter ATP-binding protein [Chimaeribacter californicus]PLR34685.1 polyamine ABC transporter ATP-binding protein [Chimaeribacter californicus]
MPYFSHKDETHSSAVVPEIKMRTEGLMKKYGATTALHPVDLNVHTGELLTLLGPSGSGKTTLLQLICGLTEPGGGELFIDGINKTWAPTHQRDIGVVFQNYALFPHLTVEENIAFPLQMRRVNAAEIRTQVARALDMVGLAGFGHRFPRELSGGQQQRVALARCLVYQPSLILMDESLSALDRQLRENMQVEIKRIHRETGATIIFVTHDQEEALALSDRVCLMNAGRIEQIGTPVEIYESPRTAFVADFIGISNKLSGQITAGGHLMCPDGQLPLPAPPTGRDHQHAVMVIRPEHIELTEHSGYLHGEVVETIYVGSETRLLIKLASGALMTARQSTGNTPRQLGERVFLHWQPSHARLIPG